MVLVARPGLRLMSGEHDRFKHYVLASELRQSILLGIPVEAMCGKRWRPDGDPGRYPMCPTCVDVLGDEEND